jgi:hypothetical protein
MVIPMRTLIICFSLLFPALLKGQGRFQLGPIYGNPYEYGSSTVAFSSMNITFTTFNIIRIVKGDRDRSNAAFGFLVGAAQTTYGLFNAKSPDKNADIYTCINISCGLTTMITSGIRLLKRNSNKSSKTAFNLYCLPGSNHYGAIAGFKVTRRLYKNY